MDSTVKIADNFEENKAIGVPEENERTVGEGPAETSSTEEANEVWHEAKEEAAIEEEERRWNEEAEKLKEKEEAGDGGEEQRRELLLSMREAIRAAGIEVDKVDNATLLRFLRARGMNVARSSKMYVEHVKWRAEMAPLGRIQDKDVRNELRTDKAYVVAQDGQRPWAYLYGRKHDTAIRNLDEFKRYAVYVIDILVDRLPPGEEKFGVVLDMGQCGYKNLDSKAMLSVFDMLQAHFPERMHRLFIVHVPYVFWAIWRVVSPFIDKRTKHKIRFVTDHELEPVLKSEIPDAILPQEYGGSAVFKSLPDGDKDDTKSMA